MPRTARVHKPDGVLHVISRGVERREIFSNDGDHKMFLAYMRESFRSFGVRLLSHCLMPNHFHFLLSPGRIPIGVPMHRLLTRYAHYYNERLGRVGHLFQDRFLSIPCRDLAYLANLVAYIHRNPLRAGLVDHPAKWPWSSHEEFVGGRGDDLQLDSLPEITGMSVDELRAIYLERIETESRVGARIPELVREAAALVGVDAADLAAGEKGKGFTIGRKLVLGWGLEAGYSMAELAKHLACAPQSLRALKRAESRLGAR